MTCINLLINIMCVTLLQDASTKRCTELAKEVWKLKTEKQTHTQQDLQLFIFCNAIDNLEKECFFAMKLSSYHRQAWYWQFKGYLKFTFVNRY